MEHIRKPEWLKIQIGANARYADTKRIVDTHKLHDARTWVNAGEKGQLLL